MCLLLWMLRHQSESFADAFVHSWLVDTWVVGDQPVFPCLAFLKPDRRSDFQQQSHPASRDYGSLLVCQESLCLAPYQHLTLFNTIQTYATLLDRRLSPRCRMASDGPRQALERYVHSCVSSTKMIDQRCWSCYKRRARKAVPLRRLIDVPVPHTQPDHQNCIFAS